MSGDGFGAGEDANGGVEIADAAVGYAVGTGVDVALGNKKHPLSANSSPGWVVRPPGAPPADSSAARAGHSSAKQCPTSASSQAEH